MDAEHQKGNYAKLSIPSVRRAARRAAPCWHWVGLHLDPEPMARYLRAMQGFMAEAVSIGRWIHRLRAAFVLPELAMS